mgnify:CR=1 FL=1
MVERRRIDELARLLANRSIRCARQRRQSLDLLGHPRLHMRALHTICEDLMHLELRSSVAHAVPGEGEDHVGHARDRAWRAMNANRLRMSGHTPQKPGEVAKVIEVGVAQQNVRGLMDESRGHLTHLAEIQEDATLTMRQPQHEHRILEEVDHAAIDRLELAILYSEDHTDQSNVAGIARTLSYNELFDVGTHDADAAKAAFGCNTFTTSGTTKAPKFVLHANESMAVHAAEVALDFGYADPTTVVQQDMPLCGVFGLTGVLAAIAAARPLVLTSAFDAERTLALMAEHKVTHFDGSDEMIDRLLRATDRDENFERIGFAGYAIFNSYLDDIVERAERRGLHAVGLWGMSEMQALVTRRDRDDPAKIRKKGGGRLVSPRAAARVRDPETGELCAEGVAGELEVKGPSRMLEYFGDAASTTETITEDGFVRTGDLCQMEPAGGFEYLTRMGDVLRLGGFLVSPAEIEAEIQAYPGVAGVQVVSASMGGADRPVAFVISEAGATVEEGPTLAHCAARLAKYKVPAKVVPLDAFPVTESANGVKIQRGKLRQMAIDLVTTD